MAAWPYLTYPKITAGSYGPSRPQRAGVVSALTVLRAASAEATATMAVTRLIRDAFCDCV